MKKVREPANVPEFVREHLRRYLATDGADGHLWDATGFGDHGMIPTLLLTTIGRRSGQAVVTPLIYGEVDGDYVLVASSGGSPRHPAWYLNLCAGPEVELQVGAEKFAAVARTAAGEERRRLWKTMAAVYPEYETLRKKTRRQIPVVVLSPAKT